MGEFVGGVGQEEGEGEGGGDGGDGEELGADCGRGVGVDYGRGEIGVSWGVDVNRGFFGGWGVSGRRGGEYRRPGR